MKNITNFIFSCTMLFMVNQVTAAPITTSTLIKIDQFGYRTVSQKIAVISIPQTGFNAPSSFVPGSTYQIRNWTTDAVVFTGTPTSWNSGGTHTQSGDKAYWFDFSSYTTAGSYYVFDVANNVGSYRFEINDNVFNNVLVQAMRTFFYQRCGVAKSAPYAQTGWTDTACHKGTQQDTDCRLYNNTAASTSKDLSGGWHDAGDHNKYVNFAYEPIINLLLAYKENPTIWSDNFNIPESGNGIPDIIDEIKVELDWLLKMQNSNGSVLSVVGYNTSSYTGGASPPSADVTNVRRYGPATTSASFSTAAMFALAAKQFNNIGQTSYATTLQNAAINAYNWAVANPNIKFYNTGVLAAGEQELSENASKITDYDYNIVTRQLASAVFLYDLTATASYKTYVESNYSNIHMLQWTYVYNYEPTIQDVLLYYASLSGATSSVATAIKNAYTSSVSSGNSDYLSGYTNNTDPYRSHMADSNYNWGSNKLKSINGYILASMNTYNLNTTNATNYTNAAEGYVHYMHGVNPLGKVYLTNMSAYGAENSVTSIYHEWFKDGSALWDEVGISTYGPAPGFIPGGPNPSYKKDACCSGSCSSNANCSTNVNPPLGQPTQKSYKDFNDSWPLNSWEVTENAIYYNAAYIRLLSKFSGNTSSLANNQFEIEANENISLYPSPAKNQINISFGKLKENNYNIDIVDLAGKIIMTKKLSFYNNSKSETINVSNLNSGVYVCKIQGNGYSVSKIFIKE